MKINTLHIAQSLGHSLPINLGHELSSTGVMVSGQCDADGPGERGEVGLYTTSLQ